MVKVKVCVVLRDGGTKMQIGEPGREAVASLAFRRRNSGEDEGQWLSFSGCFH